MATFATAPGLTVAATSPFVASCNVKLLVVRLVESKSSLNVATTDVCRLTLVCPEVGSTLITTGALMSGPGVSSKTISTQ